MTLEQFTLGVVAALVVVLIAVVGLWMWRKCWRSLRTWIAARPRGASEPKPKPLVAPETTRLANYRKGFYECDMDFDPIRGIGMYTDREQDARDALALLVDKVGIVRFDTALWKSRRGMSKRLKIIDDIENLQVVLCMTGKPKGDNDNTTTE